MKLVRDLAIFMALLLLGAAGFFTWLSVVLGPKPEGNEIFGVISGVAALLLGTTAGVVVPLLLTVEGERKRAAAEKAREYDLEIARSCDDLVSCVGADRCADRLGIDR